MDANPTWQVKRLYCAPTTPAGTLARISCDPRRRNGDMLWRGPAAMAVCERTTRLKVERNEAKIKRRTRSKIIAYSSLVFAIRATDLWSARGWRVFGGAVH